MSVARAREINARLRAAGVTVHEWPGWESRGNGQSSAYEGCLVHHTATAYGNAPSVLVNGRSDLSGPLCNYAGNADGSVTVIAAHPANHAGASGGRSMGPLPVTSLFNKRVMGLEIVYPGTVPMRTAQYRTALLWSRIVTNVLGGGNIQRARAHAETSITGKWDPGDAPGRTINMAAFRSAAAIVGANPVEDDMQPTDPVKDPGGGKWGWIWLNAQANAKAIRTHTEGTVIPQLAAIRTSVAAIANDPDIDPATLGRLIDEAVAAHTPTLEQTVAALIPELSHAIRDVMGEDNTNQADAIVDALVARLNEGN